MLADAKRTTPKQWHEEHEQQHPVPPVLIDRRSFVPIGQWISLLVPALFRTSEYSLLLSLFVESIVNLSSLHISVNVLKEFHASILK
jgi:hypothetical protein